MAGLLPGKTAVVTGGASGIGRATARRFAEHGADVVVADLREAPREGGRPTHAVVADETSARATFVECDVRRRDQLEAAIDAAEQFGGVDVMVNNAGVYRGTDFVDVTDEEFQEVVDVNQRGVFFGAQVAAERMLAAGEGCIINVSSIAGLVGLAGKSTYTLAKGGVRTLTYTLAAELGPDGVRVNAIHPGIIRTAMTTEDGTILGSDVREEEARKRIALRRVGEPEDVADAALFLASDLASYVNGESITVDGGLVNIG